MLALLTNLVAGDGATRRRFFKAARCFYRRPLTKAVDRPVWTSVQAILSKRGNPLLPLALDVVTFGTPIRYGWDCDGCVRLLHVVNHRPCDGLPAYQASFPPSLDDLFTAEGETTSNNWASPVPTFRQVCSRREAGLPSNVWPDCSSRACASGGS